jgi:hypothetical protein
MKQEVDLQLPNHKRIVVTGKARSLVYRDWVPSMAGAKSGLRGERSGPRARLAGVFKTVTFVDFSRLGSRRPSSDSFDR